MRIVLAAFLIFIGYTTAAFAQATPVCVLVNGVCAGTGGNPLTVTANQGVGVGNIATGQVSVGSTATQIVAARTGAPGTGRAAITIVNTGTTPVYIGTSGVTTSTGMLLPGVVGSYITLNTTAAVYGIVTSGTQTVSYVETF